MVTPYILNLLILFFVSFLQESSFTWSSRSRNSSDPVHHIYAVFTSTSMFFVVQTFIIKNVYQALMNESSLDIIIVGIVFAIGSSLGSAITMKLLLKYEKGNRRVGR